MIFKNYTIFFKKFLKFEIVGFSSLSFSLFDIAPKEERGPLERGNYMAARPKKYKLAAADRAGLAEPSRSCGIGRKFAPCRARGRGHCCKPAAKRIAVKSRRLPDLV